MKNYKLRNVGSILIIYFIFLTFVGNTIAIDTYSQDIGSTVTYSGTWYKLGIPYTGASMDVSISDEGNVTVTDSTALEELSGWMTDNTTSSQNTVMVGDVIQCEVYGHGFDGNTRIDLSVSASITITKAPISDEAIWIILIVAAVSCFAIIMIIKHKRSLQEEIDSSEK